MTACPQLDLTLWFIFMCKLYVIGICVKDTKYASYVIRAIPAPRPYGRGGPQQCQQDTGCWNPSPGQPLILADRSLGQGGIVQPEKKMLITSKSQLCKGRCQKRFSGLCPLRGRWGTPPFRKGKNPFFFTLIFC